MNRSIDAYMKLRYLTVIIRDECTDGTDCFRAEHPQLPGCMSHGSTMDEAIANLAEAKQLYIETLLEKNLDVPVPVQPTGGTCSTSESLVFVPGKAAMKTVIELPTEYDMLQRAS